jgi:hypothetical protein
MAPPASESARVEGFDGVQASGFLFAVVTGLSKEVLRYVFAGTERAESGAPYPKPFQ